MTVRAEVISSLQAHVFSTHFVRLGMCMRVHVLVLATY